MPPAIVAAIVTAVVSTAISIGLKLIASAIAPKPKSSNQPLDQRAAGATISTRQAIGYWTVVYGEALVGGHPIYEGTSENNDKFHRVVAMAAHEIDGFAEHLVGDRNVNPDDLDGDGYAESGTPLYFSGNPMVRIQTTLGTASQSALASLVAESGGKWTNDHRARGHALRYDRWNFQPEIYPNGIPNQASVLRGKKVYDPRDAGTRWTPNAALCIRDFLLTPKKYGGFGMETVNETVFSAAANTCDEIVASPTTGAAAISHTAVSVDATGDTITVDGDRLKLQCGDRIEVSSTGSLPSGLSPSTAYYAIPWRRRKTPKTRDSADMLPSIKVAASLADAYAQVAIDLADAGSGTITVLKTGEPRYTINGSYKLDQNPRKVLEELLTACGGRVPEGAGEMRLLGLAWAATTLTLGETDLIGPFRVQTRRARRDRFNAVRGTYVSPLNDNQPSDYPAVIGSAYETEDGERIYGDYDQPYTSRAGQAQRLAKIELVRNRFERTVSFPAKLSAYDCKAGEIIAIDNDRWNWSAKPFEVLSWRPAMIETESGAPYLSVELALNEADDSIFDWASTEESTPPPIIPPTLPDWANIPAPGTPAISEYLYEGRDGSDVKAVARMEWIASPSALVTGYEMEFWPSSGTEADAVAFATPVDKNVLLADRPDIEPGRYVFRVRGTTSIGAKTAWATTAAIEIFGLTAAPAAIESLTLQKLGGQALLRWDLHADADVRRGGWIEFRHSPDESGADESESTTIGDRVDGRSTVAAMPLKTGTYFARAVDKLGNVGPWETVSTDGALQLSYSTVGSIVEDPTFAGAHSGSVTVSSAIKIDGATLMDAWGAVDDIADWDSEGGIAAEATYTFSAGIDLGSVQRGRLRSHIRALVENTLDLVDDREANIDDWEDFDGTAPGSADAWVEYRQTQDDPAGTPTWTDWQRLDVCEVSARAFQFRCQLRSYDPAYNILVTELRAHFEDPAI